MKDLDRLFLDGRQDAEDRVITDFEGLAWHEAKAYIEGYKLGLLQIASELCEEVE